MASRIKTKPQLPRKLEPTDYRTLVAVSSALLFMLWTVLEITVWR